MSRPSSLNLDTIKFHLVWNPEADFDSANPSISTEDLIEFLIESLAGADKATAEKAESLLTRIGQPAVPYLLKGLNASDTVVKSVCAMSLIRIGDAAVKAVRDYYLRCANQPKARWVAEFVLTELGVVLPESAETETGCKILQFSKMS